MNNLFAELRTDVPGELVEILINDNHVRIERIVSHGHTSPGRFWYHPDLPEWVVVLRGAATLRFEEHDELVDMKPGDFVHIPAHARHRVESTTSDEPTIWLAVHYGTSEVQPDPCE